MDNSANSSATSTTLQQVHYSTRTVYFYKVVVVFTCILGILHQFRVVLQHDPFFHLQCYQANLPYTCTPRRFLVMTSLTQKRQRSRREKKRQKERGRVHKKTTFVLLLSLQFVTTTKWFYRSLTLYIKHKNRRNCLFSLYSQKLNYFKTGNNFFFK